MPTSVRTLGAALLVALAVVGAPQVAVAQTPTPITPIPIAAGGVKGSTLRGTAVSTGPTLNRTAFRLAQLRRTGQVNPTWRGTIATKPGTNFREITVADLKAMFPSKTCNTPRVAQGLPRLNAEMRRAKITTPARQAAFLATVAHESCFDYALNEAGVGAYYKGRGYMQLTGPYNYAAAGRALKVNLGANAELAGSLQYSAPIAGWYWTVQRPHSNAAADRYDMGLISRYVGYAPNSSQDALRCAAFKRAYTYLSGKPAPASTVCYRH